MKLSILSLFIYKDRLELMEFLYFFIFSFPFVQPLSTKPKVMVDFIG